jgi:hypothetical protein
MHLLYNFGSFFYALNIYTRMPKIIKSRKSQKTTKRRRNKSTKRRMRGGCGCNSAVPTVPNAIMQGGDSCGVPRMSGGDVLAGVPKEAYYPVSNDNRLTEANLSSRILGGGRKTKRGSKGKKHRKMSGGSALSQLGSFFSADSSITVQPNANAPNMHSPPLV